MTSRHTNAVRVTAVALATGLALAACSGGTGAGSAGGGGGGSTKKATKIKLVAAEYSKDHTKAFWTRSPRRTRRRPAYKLEVQVVSWDYIDQHVEHDDPEQQAPDILNLNAYASYAKDGLLYNSDEVLSPRRAKSDILDAFVKSGTYKGKLYGLPDLSSARAFFYNKAIFKQAGIAAPPEDLGRARGGRQEDRRPRRRQHRLRPPARPGGVAGRVLHVAVQQRRRLEDDGKWTINSPRTSRR